MLSPLPLISTPHSLSSITYCILRNVSQAQKQSRSQLHGQESVLIFGSNIEHTVDAITGLLIPRFDHVATFRCSNTSLNHNTQINEVITEPIIITDIQSHFTNCSFQNCVSHGNGGSLQFSPVIEDISYRPLLHIVKCTFVNGSCSGDGGFIFYDAPSTRSALQVASSSFSNGHAGNSGGALYIVTPTDQIWDSDSFVNSSAKTDAGTLLSRRGSLCMANTTILSQPNPEMSTLQCLIGSSFITKSFFLFDTHTSSNGILYLHQNPEDPIHCNHCLFTNEVVRDSEPFTFIRLDTLQIPQLKGTTFYLSHTSMHGYAITALDISPSQFLESDSLDLSPYPSFSPILCKGNVPINLLNTISEYQIHKNGEDVKYCGSIYPCRTLDYPETIHRMIAKYSLQVKGDFAVQTPFTIVPTIHNISGFLSNLTSTNDVVPFFIASKGNCTLYFHTFTVVSSFMSAFLRLDKGVFALKKISFSVTNSDPPGLHSLKPLQQELSDSFSPFSTDSMNSSLIFQDPSTRSSTVLTIVLSDLTLPHPLAQMTNSNVFRLYQTNLNNITIETPDVSLFNLNSALVTFLQSSFTSIHTSAPFFSLSHISCTLDLSEVTFTRCSSSEGDSLFTIFQPRVVKIHNSTFYRCGGKSAGVLFVVPPPSRSLILNVTNTLFDECTCDSAEGASDILIESEIAPTLNFSGSRSTSATPRFVVGSLELTDPFPAPYTSIFVIGTGQDTLTCSAQLNPCGTLGFVVRFVQTPRMHVFILPSGSFNETNVHCLHKYLTFSCTHIVTFTLMTQSIPAFVATHSELRFDQMTVTAPDSSSVLFIQIQAFSTVIITRSHFVHNNYMSLFTLADIDGESSLRIEDSVNQPQSGVTPMYSHFLRSLNSSLSLVEVKVADFSISEAGLHFISFQTDADMSLVITNSSFIFINEFFDSSLIFFSSSCDASFHLHSSNITVNFISTYSPIFVIDYHPSIKAAELCLSFERTAISRDSSGMMGPNVIRVMLSSFDHIPTFYLSSSIVQNAMWKSILGLLKGTSDPVTLFPFILPDLDTFWICTNGTNQLNCGTETVPCQNADYTQNTILFEGSLRSYHIVSTTQVHNVIRNTHPTVEIDGESFPRMRIGANFIEPAVFVCTKEMRMDTLSFVFSGNPATKTFLFSCVNGILCLDNINVLFDTDRMVHSILSAQSANVTITDILLRSTTAVFGTVFVGHPMFDVNQSTFFLTRLELTLFYLNSSVYESLITVRRSNCIISEVNITNFEINSNSPIVLSNSDIYIEESQFSEMALDAPLIVIASTEESELRLVSIKIDSLFTTSQTVLQISSPNSVIIIIDLSFSNIDTHHVKDPDMMLVNPDSSLSSQDTPSPYTLFTGVILKINLGEKSDLSISDIVFSNITDPHPYSFGTMFIEQTASVPHFDITNVSFTHCYCAQASHFGFKLPTLSRYTLLKAIHTHISPDRTANMVLLGKDSVPVSLLDYVFLRPWELVALSLLSVFLIYAITVPISYCIMLNLRKSRLAPPHLRKRFCCACCQPDHGGLLEADYGDIIMLNGGISRWGGPKRLTDYRSMEVHWAEGETVPHSEETGDRESKSESTREARTKTKKKKKSADLSDTDSEEVLLDSSSSEFV